MTTLDRIHRKEQIGLPSPFGGDGNLADRHTQFPSADKGYTPAQRRATDRGIAWSEKEYKQSRSFGPFDTHEAFMASLHKGAAKLRAKTTKRAAK